MDDGTTALSNRPRPRSSPGGPRAAVIRGVEPHHRRRRATALSVLAALALVAGVTAGAGAGSAPGHPASPATVGFFGRIQALAGDGATSFTAVEQAAENSAIDRTLSYTPYVRVAGAQHRELALTFDDGPGPYTPQLLSVLAKYNAPATFFEVGVLERYFHASTTEIVARGDPIGDHTELHAPMSRLSPADQQSELLQQTSAIGQYGAPFPRLFRPPYGLWDNATLALLRKYRMLMVLWTVDTNDYLRPGVGAIINSAVSGARPGAIILMHDGGGDRTETIAALPEIITKLRARGYKLVTVPKLLLDNPAPGNQNITGLTGAGG